MDDAQRILEQHALRNTRSLVDTLEQAEAAARKRQKFVVLAAVAPVLAAFALIFSHATEKADVATSSPKSELSPCVASVVASRTEAYENDLRRTNPEMTRRERSERLARERPFFIAAGKVECSPAPR